MKTQKRFVISGMFKTLKFLGICLILIALFAPTAHAVTVVVDPGAVGGEAKGFNFSANTGLQIDILWADNKTLEWEAGTHVFSVVGSPGSLGYTGILLDAVGNEIPGTEFIGETPTLAGGDNIHFLGFIELPEMTVFGGIRFLSIYTSNVELSWNWNKNDRPVVGETQASGNQPPKAEAGAPVTGEVDVAVTFDGIDSVDPDGGTIVQYDWDFGDNTPKAIDAGPTPTHTYTSSGEYPVILTVTDNDGETDDDNAKATITIGNQAPTRMMNRTRGEWVSQWLSTAVTPATRTAPLITSLRGYHPGPGGSLSKRSERSIP